MARIRDLFHENRASRPHPTEVDCGWTVVHTSDGGKLVQLSTYGSDFRASDKKVSQTIQVDRATAAELVALLKGTFDL